MGDEQTDDLRDWLISVDDHLFEPPDLWVSRVPARDRDRVPHVEVINGIDTWVYEKHRTSLAGILVAAHLDRKDYKPVPVNYADVPEAYYDPVARLVDMDRDHVLASLCFPFVPRFCGQAFSETQDKELALTCLRIYNDWIIDDWCGAAPGRYIPMIVIPFWDPALAVEEVLRCAGRGARAVAFSENLHSLGYASIHSGEWDDLFAVLSEAELPLCTHIGSSSTVPSTGPDAPYGITAVNINFNLALSTTDWLFSGKFQKFPNLKIVLAEGGIGWIPFLLERAEQVALKYASSRGINWVHDRATGLMNPVPADPTLFPESPRQLFRDHMYGCFIQDEFGAANLDAIGVENVMIETDYPHTDTLWPNSLEMAQKMLAGQSESAKHKVLRGNAMRIFHFEPAAPPTA